MRRTETAPVATLEQQMAALEQALAMCVSKAGKRPVHKLRTATRRVETQLLLLQALEGLPPHQQEHRKVLRELAKLRRAAGVIRDLDVQQAMLARLCSVRTKQAEPLKHSAQKLQAKLASKRDARAEKLSAFLHKRGLRVMDAFGRLMHVLDKTSSTRFHETPLLNYAEDFVRKAWPPSLTSKGKAGSSMRTTTRQLHDLRKAAKRARYLAESLPGAARASHTARRFEALQNAGGRWHDELELSKLARKELGKKDDLALYLASRASTLRRTYISKLARDPLSSAAIATHRSRG